MASIGFIGVGKLGQACAEMVAEVHDVVGYDDLFAIRHLG